jgi:hypothetical protein
MTKGLTNINKGVRLSTKQHSSPNISLQASFLLVSCFI